MNTLPKHGCIDCNRCYKNLDITFNETINSGGKWRITANPMAWGNHNPKIVVLGFSKGPRQIKDIDIIKHEDIAYKGSRLNVARILAHVGLLPNGTDQELKDNLHQVMNNDKGDFHFASLIRCTVERLDNVKGWTGTGGGMLDKFVDTTFGENITLNCMENYLSVLPAKAKLVIMFGMGTKGNYVKACNQLYKIIRPGNWAWLNEVAYTDGKITVVHVEHFTSQGALIPNWRGLNDNPRSKLGMLAKQAVTKALE